LHPSPHGGAQGSHIPLDAFQNMPVGIIGALNALPQPGVELRGVNIPVELRINPAFSIEDWLVDYDPHIALVELHWYVHTHGALTLADTIRTTNPRTFIVMGGLTASAFPRDILERYSSVDMIIAGEAENGLLSLRDCFLKYSGRPEQVEHAWFRDESGKIIEPDRLVSMKSVEHLDHTSLSWLDNHDEFERSDFPYRNRWLLSGRGCGKTCFFCGGSRHSMETLYNRRSVLTRPPERVADDIIRLGRSGVQAVHLSHDIMTQGKEYWRPLFKRIRHSRIHVGLGNESWGPVPDSDLLHEWRATFDVEHSYIALSPTSAWSGLRRFASRRNEDEHLLESIDLLSRFNFPLHVFFLLNVPGETAETLERTLDVAWSIIKNYPTDLLRMEAQTASIDPCSPAALDVVPSISFQRPRFDDYLSVSRGQYIPELNWPERTEEIDPGDPIDVPRARPGDLFKIGMKCPSLMKRWQELITSNTVA